MNTTTGSTSTDAENKAEIPGAGAVEEINKANEMPTTPPTSGQTKSPTDLETPQFSPSNNPEVIFEDRKEGTDYFGVAKYGESGPVIKTRDNVTDGFKKYFVIAFKSDQTSKIAYVYNYDSAQVETVDVADIHKEEGQSNYASFVKAREKFHALISPAEVNEDKSEDKAREAQTVVPSVVKAKKDRHKQVILNETPSIQNERRSPRIAKQKRQDSAPKISQIEKRLITSEKKKRAGRKNKAGSSTSHKRSAVKQSDSNSNKMDIDSDPDLDSEPDLELNFVKSPIQTSVVPLRIKESKPTIISKEQSEKKEELQRTTDSIHSSPASSIQSSVETAKTGLMTQLDSLPSPNKPLLIPLAWHEEHMAKIRETYMRQTILNLQMSEMLQLTTPNAINFNKL